MSIGGPYPPWRRLNQDPCFFHDGLGGMALVALESGLEIDNEKVENNSIPQKKVANSYIR